MSLYNSPNASINVGEAVVHDQLTVAGVLYPTTVGQVGQTLIMGENDAIEYADVVGTAVQEGQGINLDIQDPVTIISVDPTSAFVPLTQVAPAYSFVAGNQIPNLAPGSAVISIGKGSLANAVNLDNVINIGNSNFGAATYAGNCESSISIGNGNLASTNGANNNIAVGQWCLHTLNDVTSGGNTTMGNLAGSNIQAGGNNVAIGAGVLGTSIPTPITKSNNNVAIGLNVMQKVSTSSGWTSSGTSTAGSNVGIGTNVMNNLTTGIQNVSIGPSSSTALTTGSNNVSIGTSANSNVTTGSFNVLINGDAVPYFTSTSLVASASATSQVRICETAQSLNIGGVGVQAMLEANTLDYGYMSTSMTMCPKELSYGSVPAVSSAFGTGYTINFPSETEIEALPTLEVGYVLSVTDIIPPTVGTAGTIDLNFINPSTGGLQENAEFELHCTVSVTELSQAANKLGGPIAPYDTSDSLGLHSASVIFQRTGDVVQCYISGNTPAINYIMGADHHSPSTAPNSVIQSVANNNYLSLLPQVVLNDALAPDGYDADQMFTYGRVVGLFTVAPDGQPSDPDNNIISSSLAPAVGCTFSQDFTVCPVRAFPAAGQTTQPGGHWLKFPVVGATYLGGCYSYSPINAANGDEVGSNATIRLTVTSFNSMSTGTLQRMVGVSMCNVTHPISGQTTNTRGTDRNVLDFTQLVQQIGTDAANPSAELTGLMANCLLRVQPQGIQIGGQDTAPNPALYTVFFPENYEPNGGVTTPVDEDYCAFADGGGEPKISLNYVVFPSV